MVRFTYSGIALVVLPALLLAAAACSSSNNNNTPANTGATNTGTKPAASVAAPAVSSSARAVASPSAGSPAAAAGPIEEDTSDLKFSQTTITIKAGQPATVNVVNKGPSIHNWHVEGVKDDSGKDIMTPLQDSGKTASITFSISKKGTYNFQCDSHPADMKGQLVVE